MENEDAALIESVLKQNGQDIEFEPIPEEKDSPLAQPVVQKSNTSGDVEAVKQAAQTTTSEPAKETQATQDTASQTKESYQDAPEQEINAEPTGEDKQDQAGTEEGEFSMPLEHAQLMADSIIGSVNNTVLEVGGGYFVTISKHKDFYDFEEIIQVIEEQNVKNIKRLKLDEEDKALIRPLLIQILRKKAAVMSPEKQLLMVVFSILIKKTKVVMEIRAENEALVERIRDVIRKEMQAAKEEAEQSQERQRRQSMADEKNKQEQYEDTQADDTETIYEEVHTVQGRSNTGLPDEILEQY